MQCGRKLAKHALLFINVSCMVFAVILIIMGGMMLLDVYKWMDGVKETIPFLIIGLGCLIFFFALLGFCGAIKENNCLTLIYSILMLTLLTLQVLLIFYTYYDQDKLVTILEKSCKKAWKLRQEGNDGWMNVIQKGLKCCGENGTSDYISSGTAIPKSCLIQRSKRLPVSFATEGCRSAIKSRFLKDLDLIQYVLFAVASLKILMFALGCYVSGGGGLNEIEFISVLHH